jgi:hypothetical protein
MKEKSYKLVEMLENDKATKFNKKTLWLCAVANL